MCFVDNDPINKKWQFYWFFFLVKGKETQSDLYSTIIVGTEEKWPIDILWKKVLCWFSRVVLFQFLTWRSISWSYGCWIYNYLCNQCLSPLSLWVWIPFRQGVHDTTLCDKVCQWLATGQWFSPGTSVYSTNNTDRHDIAEILLKVALNTITHTPNF